ncbi:hypothetical protein [Demequina salsinemoris]|nr:hypothetical protein [Demequina salsinemoris]
MNAAQATRSFIALSRITDAAEKRAALATHFDQYVQPASVCRLHPSASA